MWFEVRGSNTESKDRLLGGTNGDLWAIRENESDTQQITKKVKAHAEAEVLNGQLNPFNFLLNLLADAAADACAELAVNTLAVQEYEKWSAIAYLIAMRLAVLQVEVDENTPDLVPLVMESTPSADVSSVPRK